MSASSTVPLVEALAARPHPAPPPALAALPGGIAEEVRKQAAAGLGTGFDAGKLEAVIRQVLEENTPASPGRAEGLSRNSSAGGGQTSKMESVLETDGALLVRSAQAFASQDDPSNNAVLVADAVQAGPKGPGIGYMQFAATSFDWTFVADEVLVVIEGELQLIRDSAVLAAGPGDVLRVSAGANFTLASSGLVRCVYSAWSK
jgi:ethanolamine utilization protein EutQ (cupin superfamily)